MCCSANVRGLAKPTRVDQRVLPADRQAANAGANWHGSLGGMPMSQA